MSSCACAKITAKMWMSRDLSTKVNRWICLRKLELQQWQLEHTTNIVNICICILAQKYS